MMWYRFRQRGSQRCRLTVNEGEFVTVTVTLSEALSEVLSVPLHVWKIRGFLRPSSTDYHGPGQVTIRPEGDFWIRTDFD